MSVENLNLDNAQKEVTVTNMELDKKEGQKSDITVIDVQGHQVPMEELVVKEQKPVEESTIQPGKPGEMLPGQAAEGDHDGRDGDPELINFLMDNKDKYIRVEIRADIVDGKPVIRTEEEIKTSGGQLGKYLIWAKFLRPGWKLSNLIQSKKLSITSEGNFIMDSKFYETVLKYLLKEWNIPLQLVFGIDQDNNEIISNLDTIIGPAGVCYQIIDSLMDKVRGEIL